MNLPANAMFLVLIPSPRVAIKPLFQILKMHELRLVHFLEPLSVSLVLARLYAKNKRHESHDQTRDKASEECWPINQSEPLSESTDLPAIACA